jgi:hypothetical protein
MNNNHPKYDYRLFFLIGTPKLIEQAEALFTTEAVPIQYHICAQGTASGEIIDMLGLGSGNLEKTVLMSPVSKSLALEMMDTLSRKLYLGSPNTGIAFTLPINGGISRLMRLLESMEDPNATFERMNTNTMEYSMIMALVNQGYSEEIMAAAKAAGATGGTVFHSRQAGSENATKLWGITIQPEREIVLIVCEKSKKAAIMKAINTAYGANSEARCFLISLPVEDVCGLH